MCKPRIERSGDGLLLWIKAVPGASCSQIAGVLGDRLKIRVAAPPENGKANHAICDLLADALGLTPREVSVESGHTNSAKVVRIRGTNEAVVAALAE